MQKAQEIINLIRTVYNEPREFIPLHAPVFVGNEKKYLNECIDSTFVSSVGKFVDQFEEMMRNYTGAKYAIATMNGTSALHLALEIAGAKTGDLVITQSLSFVATSNAISYTGAQPYYIDVDLDTLGMSDKALEQFLENVELVDGTPIHKDSGKRVAACVPMHTFGFPCNIQRIVDLCNEFNIPVVEDAAESLGSTIDGKHTGTFGTFGTYSFNGNKTITSGGGGIIVTNDEALAKRAKHMSTQAKVPHKWEYDHDEVGYNYRCPNINAALACAQLEKLDEFLKNKAETAQIYAKHFDTISDVRFFEYSGEESVANNWLNVLLFDSEKDKLDFLEESNSSGVMTRPIWKLNHKLKSFSECGHDDLKNSLYLEKHLINIPSSVRL